MFKSIAGLELSVNTIGSGLTMPIQFEIDSAPTQPGAYINDFEGWVVSYSVIDRGTGYTTQPSIIIDGDASAEAIMVGGVEEILFMPSGDITTPTPTPTISHTLTPSISRSPTATVTPSKSLTATPTKTITPTPSITQSITPTCTPTQTQTPTLTRTPTLTPSITPTSTFIIEHCAIDAHPFSGFDIENNSFITSQNLGLSPGSGFRAPPNIVFEGLGIKAEALTEVSGGIQSVDIAMAGEGYQIAPEIKVQGDGIGAKLAAKISGYVYKTFISDPGLYASGTVLNITASSGNAVFSGIMSQPNIDNGLISLLEVDIVNPGSDYDSIPLINIDAPTEQTARPARAYCSINAGLSEIEVISPGYGYTKSPKLFILRKEPESDEKYLDRSRATFTDITPTPTSTPSPTNTQTPSNSPTTTCTSSPSPTTTATPTQSLTLTPSISYSPTPSITPSDYTNLVISLTGSIDPTPTSSITATPTNSITPSPTVTKTKTPTPTLTPTKTTTPTNTVTKTSSPTLTPTSTVTPTQSQTPSITPSPSMNHPNMISYDAVLIPRMSYGISKINIIDPGRYRYNNIPTLKADPSYTAEYKAVIDDKTYRFESTPSTKIIGSTISSAFRTTKDPECFPIINYKITSVDIIDGGYDYTLPPKIVLHGGYDPIKGVKAELTATVSSGAITNINIDNGGDFYRSYPDIKILSQDDTGYGLKIRLKLTGELEDIYITEVGQNLTPNSPNNKIIFEGGGGSGNSPPQAHIVLNNTAGSGFNGVANINYHISYVKPLSSDKTFDFSPEVTVSPDTQKVFNNQNPRPGIVQSRIEGVSKQLQISYTGTDFSQYTHTLLGKTRCNYDSYPNLAMVASKPILSLASNVVNINQLYMPSYWAGYLGQHQNPFWISLYSKVYQPGPYPIYHSFTVPVAIDSSITEWLSLSRLKLKTGLYNIINTSHSSKGAIYITQVSGSHIFTLSFNSQSFPFYPVGNCYHPDTIGISNLDSSRWPSDLQKGIDYTLNSELTEYCNPQISLNKSLPSGTRLSINAIVFPSGDLSLNLETGTLEPKINDENLFYEKPQVLLETSYALSSKTYLEFAGYSASYTGASSDWAYSHSHSGLVSTQKGTDFININSSNPRIQPLTPAQKVPITSISHPDYTYSNIYLPSNSIGCHLSIEGSIVGLADVPTMFTRTTNTYPEYLVMPNFFDTLPTLTIEDEISNDSVVYLSQNSNNQLTRLAHFVNYSGYTYRPANSEPFNKIKNWLLNPSGYIQNAHDEWYGISNTNIASGIFKSDIEVYSNSNHTSRAILVCNSGGIPTSWNNPPSFTITVSSGHISNITINNQGKGFGQSLIVDNLPSGISNAHTIYFSGGGGYGASGILLSSWPGSGNPYENMATITGIVLLNSGTGYTSSPLPIIIDGSPTWNNIEYNNKLLNYNNKAMKQFIAPPGSKTSQSFINQNNIGIFPLVNFYFTDSKIAECRPIAALKKYQISQGFISAERDGHKQATGLEQQPDYWIAARHILNSNYSWTKEIQVAIGDRFKPFPDPYRIHSHYHNGSLDDILVDYIINTNNVQLPGYISTPEIRISNADVIANANTVLPTVSAKLPKWKNIFTNNTLIRQDEPIQ